MGKRKLIHMFKYVKGAWDAYKRNYFPLIVTLMFIFFVSILVFIVGVLITASTTGPTTVTNEVKNLITATSEFAMDPTNMYVLKGLTATSTILLGFFALSIGVAIAMNAGYVGMANEALKGKTSLIFGGKGSTFFNTTKKFGIHAIKANIFIYAIMWMTTLFMYKLMYIFFGEYIALSFSIAYLFVLSIFMQLAVPAIVLNKLTPLAGVQKSIDVVKRNFPIFFSIVIFYYILSNLLIIVWPLYGTLVVVFVILPMSTLSIVMFFKEKS